MIEIMSFRLAEPSREAEFLAADRAVQEDFAYQQPGLLRRTTARSDDGEWAVIDLWRSPEDSAACEVRWADDPVAQRFMSHLDADSVRVAQYRQLD